MVDSSLDKPKAMIRNVASQPLCKFMWKEWGARPIVCPKQKLPYGLSKTGEGGGRLWVKATFEQCAKKILFFLMYIFSYSWRFRILKEHLKGKH